MRAKRRKTRSVEVEVVVVGIDSNYEPVTKAGWEYRKKHVYPYLQKNGFKVTRFEGKLARRYLVAPEVAKPNVDYVTGVGHGLEDLYTGDYGDQIFKVGQYSPEESRGKIAHFLSCQTARRLGPDFVVHGCRAYFGYDVNFTFTWDSSAVFFECDSEIDRAFGDGLAAGQVYRRVYNHYTKRIDQLRAAGKDYVAATLETDRDHLCAPSVANHWGDKKAKLE
jgi:hypothetical protein